MPINGAHGGDKALTTRKKSHVVSFGQPERAPGKLEQDHRRRSPGGGGGRGQETITPSKGPMRQSNRQGDYFRHADAAKSRFRRVNFE